MVAVHPVLAAGCGLYFRMIVLMAGLPGTGKSTLACELAKRTGGVVLDKDAIRPALFPAGDIEFSSEQDDFCQHIMLLTAEYLLRRNPERVILLDGRPFSRRYQIDDVIRSSNRVGTPWRILECVCGEATAKERLGKGGHPAANRDFELYLAVRARFEPIERKKTVIDTDRALEKCVEEALGSLLVA